jgi:hypothetical protein
LERQEEWKRYEALLEKLNTGGQKVEMGLESLKLTKLSSGEDIEAFLTTFERAVEAHNVEREKWAPILATQLTGKGLEAYAAMENVEARDYDRVKQPILQWHIINEETYRQRFWSIKPKEEETPIELVIRIRGLAEKWLKKYGTREHVVDAVIKEQFILALSNDLRVLVTERRPSTSTEAGQLAEDYWQARKLKDWSTIGKNETPKRCHSCGLIGHIARDCSNYGEKKSKPSIGSEVKKELICYNCKGKGHTSRHCASKVMFCRPNRNLRCRGMVEETEVGDILLDTGCSQTLVRKDLVKSEKMKEGRLVDIQCAHGDTTWYPLAEVELSVEGKKITVEAAVSETLPQSVLLGIDVPELEDLMINKSSDEAFAVTTRSMAVKEQQEEEDRKKKRRVRQNQGNYLRRVERKVRKLRENKKGQISSLILMKVCLARGRTKLV